MLSRVDDLPGLIVLLFETVAGFAEIENHRDQHRETAEVLENFQKGPAAKGVGKPGKRPLEGEKGTEPSGFARGVTSPGTGWVVLESQNHGHYSSTAVDADPEAGAAPVPWFFRNRTLPGYKVFKIPGPRLAGLGYQL